MHNSFSGFSFIAHLPTVDGGEVTVSLQTTLGSIQEPSIHQPDVQIKSCGMKPSRIRRRQRRKEARTKAANFSSDVTNESSDVQDRDRDAINQTITQDQDMLPVSVHDIATKPTMVHTAVRVAPNLDDKACEPLNFLAPKKILSFTKCSPISIAPRPIYHPAIINASKAMHGKHPSELTPEEVHKFNFYLRWKKEQGEPVESDIVYLPSSMRNCLHFHQTT